jgi:hypothetical protein
VVEAAFAALQFRFQRAAHGDVQLLEAAADAEQRHATGDDGPDQLQGGGVAAVVIGLVVSGGLLAIMRGVHVGDGTRHQDAVEMGEHAVEVVVIELRGDHHGIDVGHIRQCTDVFVAKRMEEETVFFIGVGGKADEGAGLGHDLRRVS